MDNPLALLFFIAALFLVPVALNEAGACSDATRTERTLDAAGYTDIEAGGYDYFACGEGDSFSTHFTAKNPQGETVEGTVCCGWWKSCTVRY